MTVGLPSQTGPAGVGEGGFLMLTETLLSYIRQQNPTLATQKSKRRNAEQSLTAVLTTPTPL